MKSPGPRFPFQSVPPKILEPVRRQLSIAPRVPSPLVRPQRGSVLTGERMGERDGGARRLGSPGLPR
jgi:hypothetical protein